MINLPKVRYAIIVAIVGVAVSMWPGLMDVAATVIQAMSLIIGGLWSLLRIAEEFFVSPTAFVDQGDEEFHTMLRTAGNDNAWTRVRRAL